MRCKPGSLPAACVWCRGMAETIQLYVRVTPEVAEQIRQIAEENDRSLSAEVARLIRQRIAEVDGPRAAA